MDVVLVRTNLIRPRPLVEIGRRREVVEASIPEDSAYDDVSLMTYARVDNGRQYQQTRR